MNALILTDRPCQVEKAIDGDTVQLGFIDVNGEDAKLPGLRLRLLGVDSPEMKGATKLAGLQAKQFTEEWLRAGRAIGGDWPFRITTTGHDDFGRLLGHLTWASNGESLATALLSAHEAVVYHS